MDNFYNKLLMGTAVATVLCSVPLMTQAHHGSASHFDASKEVNVTGTITRFAFTNPHAYVYFDVEDENGEIVEWRCESRAATAMKRAGWTKDTLTAGQEIEVTGIPGRREANLCYANQMIVNGLEYSANSAPPNAEEIAASVYADQAEDRSQTVAGGQPNISGYWVRDDRNRRRPQAAAGAQGGMGAARPARRGPELTEAGELAAAKYDDRFDNPAINCEPTSIIHAWTHDSNINAVAQTEDQVKLTYGFMDLERTIHLNSEHPANLESSILGYSVGTWEGDTLVVETKGLSERILNGALGVYYSDQTTIVEKFSYNAETNHLERAYTITDPVYFAEPFTGSDQLIASVAPYETYGCENHSGSNNVRDEG